MVIYENKEDVIRFHHKIKSIFNQNIDKDSKKRQVLKYILEAEWPRLGIDPSIEIGKRYPYYSICENYIQLETKLSVSKVTGCNVSETLRSKFEVYSNRSRVEKSIPYILGMKDELCRPIEIHKINDNYYINNGKHRFYAHLLLNLEEIPVMIKEYTYDIDKSYINYISNGEISFNLFDRNKYHRINLETHSDYLKDHTYKTIKTLLKLGVKVLAK